VVWIRSGTLGVKWLLVGRCLLGFRFGALGITGADLVEFPYGHLWVITFTLCVSDAYA